MPLKLTFWRKALKKKNYISYEISKRVNFIEANSGMVVGRGWGEEKTELLIKGYKASVKQGE